MRVSEDPSSRCVNDVPPGRPWYAGVTRYQWLVLTVASAGWIFDAFEGQLFNITRNQLLADILGKGGTDAAIKNYGDVFLAVFLTGGTLGGLLFGSLADRWGRRPVMAVTILMYSIFSGATFFAQSLWQVGVARFLVAMGVGGEWAVAASLVAEVFSKEARAHASGIFHATSVLGVWAAADKATAAALSRLALALDYALRDLSLQKARAENGDAQQRKAMAEGLARFIRQHAGDGVFVAERVPAAKQAARYGLPKE